MRVSGSRLYSLIPYSLFRESFTAYIHSSGCNPTDMVGRASPPGSHIEAYCYGIVNSRGLVLSLPRRWTPQYTPRPRLCVSAGYTIRKGRRILRPPESRLLTEVITENHWFDWYEGEVTNTDTGYP